VSKQRLPKHIGVIPDGNRRWAVARGMAKGQGYVKGIDPGLELFKLIQKAGIKEVTYYGFTTDNVKRPQEQRKAFVDACIQGVEVLSHEDADLLVVGNTASKAFPKELLPYTGRRKKFGKGGTKVNFLVNYGWEWDLSHLNGKGSKQTGVLKRVKSAQISRIDLILRWGGRSRLSGFLPAQSIYADIYVIDAMWPDFKRSHFDDALKWYASQDITLGG
jgi:undecaprenyl diphosphate synthase